MSQTTKSKNNSPKVGRNFRVSNSRGYTLGSETNYVRSGGPRRAAKRLVANLAHQMKLQERHHISNRTIARSRSSWLNRRVAAEHIYPLA